ncbi:hypothetical protein CYMTET_47306 [Cymbomonas tetramitiformis]|uniref:RING-type domain-containing protein n=1 Tax=Cymbomonas tetramitiformis TaxID=36881 RepID=A0AAE0EWT5_9CHLO|nr:hypothetical protein CYMTET_47306 [Cymbomonas tetramitiformis]
MPFVSLSDLRPPFFANADEGDVRSRMDTPRGSVFASGEGGCPCRPSRLFASTPPTECTVCLESLFDESAPDRDNALLVYQFSCGHFFHYRCIYEWIDRSNRSCPICRRVLDIDTLRCEHDVLCDLREELRRRLRVSSSFAGFEYSYSRRWIVRVGLAYEYLSTIAAHGKADVFFYKLHADDLTVHGLLERALDCNIQQADFGILAYTDLRRWFALANRKSAALAALVEKGCVDAHIFLDLRSDFVETNLAEVALASIIHGNQFDANAYTLLKDDLESYDLVNTGLESVIRTARFDPFFLMDEKHNIRSACLKRTALSKMLPQIEFTSYAFQIFRVDLTEAGLLPEVLLRIIDMQDFTVYRYLELRVDLWEHDLAANALSNLLATNRLTHDLLWRVDEDLRRTCLLGDTLRRLRQSGVPEATGERTGQRKFPSRLREMCERCFVCRYIVREVFCWWRRLGTR